MNAPGYKEDIDRTASCAGLRGAIEAEVQAGHKVAFIGASNGGHVAVEMAQEFGACWIILASSAPWLQQMRMCSTWQMPLVMTICDGEGYFGGAHHLWGLAKIARAYAVWSYDPTHCHESWDVQLRAASVVSSQLADVVANRE